MNKYNWKNAFSDTPQNFHNKVNMTLKNLPSEKESQKMTKKILFRKGIIFALIGVFILGTGAFAMGKVASINSHSSSIPTYKSMPTSEQVKEDLGYEIKLLEQFDNSYKFKEGHIVYREGVDEQGNGLGESKGIDFNYAKAGDKIIFTANNEDFGQMGELEKLVDTYKGINLYYYSYANKFVSGDYQMNDQDKKDEASGKYVFSFGVEKNEVVQVQCLSWTQEGINYFLLGMDCDLDRNEIVEMAKQVIDAK